MQQDLTNGKISVSLITFAFPMMAGNLLQQLYNVADTFIVGRFLGSDALAAVGSSYTLMVFLTSILLGLCMGSGAVFSICYGQKREERLKNSIFLSFAFISIVTFILNTAAFLCINPIIRLLHVPGEVAPYMKEYLFIIFFGIIATFLYNYFATLLRAVGNSTIPLLFLGISSVLNVVLDCVFVFSFQWGVAGAAAATVLSQYISGFGIFLYTWFHFPQLHIERRHIKWQKNLFREIISFFFSYLYAAVYYEFRHFAGSGSGQQLWHRDYGRLCCGCKN